VQYVFLWGSGAPSSRATPDSPHSSYATVWILMPMQLFKQKTLWIKCIEVLKA